VVLKSSYVPLLPLVPSIEHEMWGITLHTVLANEKRILQTKISLNQGKREHCMSKLSELSERREGM